MEALSRTAAAKAAGGLTAREVEMLRLAATGKPNRAIDDDSLRGEETVPRHVISIFTRLGQSSRAAATAYTREHYLL